VSSSTLRLLLRIKCCHIQPILTCSDSLLYLPLADATVITFLAPSLACWACSYFIHEPFTRMEQIAAYVSLFGVVIIARPMSLFAFLSHSDHSTPAESSPNGTTGLEHVTPAQRAAAVGVAMLGVIGSAGAYTTLRWIGKRAHPLISVNYFAVWCTIVSIVMMATLPGVGFLLPRSAKDWCYLIFLGICGFVMVTRALALSHLPPTALTHTLAIPPRSRPAVRKVLTRNKHGLHPDALRAGL
jgi:drug/metabolite transporter (DMT)-like permease